MFNKIKQDNNKATGFAKKIGAISLILNMCFASLSLIGCEERWPKKGGKYSGRNDILADFSEGLSDKFSSADWASGGIFDCR